MICQRVLTQPPDLKLDDTKDDNSKYFFSSISSIIKEYLFSHSKGRPKTYILYTIYIQSTVCPGSSDPFYLVIHYIKWTYCIYARKVLIGMLMRINL